MKSEHWIIFGLGGGLMIMALLSFFRVPLYEKAAWFIIGTFASAFTMVIGYKFGKAMPEQAGDPKLGQTSETTTTSATTPVVGVEAKELP